MNEEVVKSILKFVEDYFEKFGELYKGLSKK